MADFSSQVASRGDVAAVGLTAGFEPISGIEPTNKPIVERTRHPARDGLGGKPEHHQPHHPHSPKDEPSRDAVYRVYLVAGRNQSDESDKAAEGRLPRDVDIDLPVQP